MILCFFRVESNAQVVVDKTCATCGRQNLDSLNLKVRNIRVNQVGYLPDDGRKRAFVANAKTTDFKVIDAATRTVAYQGNLSPQGTFREGGLDIHGYFNSIKPLYNLTRPNSNVVLSLADFSPLKTPGRYFIVSGADTSSTFTLDPMVYNHIFTTTLQFFGAQRCGATNSWFHKACHRKDGSALGADFSGALAGGWHDCGDHGKFGETEGYAALILALTYAYWPQKGEDFYGASYADTLPFGTDGIPDVLYEAKIGVDYILKLYKASVAKGLLASGDMYHSVGNGPPMDHLYWDVPENQEAQPQNKGGPDRPVTAGIGSDVAGTFAAALAFFAWGWEPFNPAYAKECLNAAKDIYAKIVIARRNTRTKNVCCYAAAGPSKDDEALAALALWFATKDPAYRFDLLENKALGNAPNAVFNKDEFPSGLLGNSPFYAGWPTDYENNYALTQYGLAKLIVGNHQTAAQYGLTPAVADSLKQTSMALLKRQVQDGTNGRDNTSIPGIRFTPPYNGVNTSGAWGFNRYNLGSVIGIFMYWDLTGNKDYYNIGIDNLNYNLGLNPWDICFVMGAGDKNLQHPHNRASNPEGYNAGGFPYEYKVPKGALMGGVAPESTLVDVWSSFTVSETCIDYSAQFAIPAQMLAADLPEDKVGPKYRNVNVIPEDVRATVSWTTDELSRDTLYLLDGPGGAVLQAVSPDTLARNKQLELLNLKPATTYYFWFKGMDIRRNITEDKNGGAYYKFTTLSGPKEPAKITGVRVCNETHDQATVSWWTRNGSYDSRVDYDLATVTGKPTKVQQPDDRGLPTVFHAVTLKSLEPATGYKYSVTSGSTTDDSAGGYYRFKTTQVLVNYDIRVKATNKAQQPGGFQVYIDITNNEQKPYTGVELRFYFTASAGVAAGLTAKGNDNQMRGVGGSDIGIDVAYGTNGDGRPVALPGFTDMWYFPIVIKSTLPVAGRASIDLQIFTGNAWTTYPFSAMTDAWSIIRHIAPPDPVAFEGVDFSRALSGQYTGPEPIEEINGVNTITYVKTPYISAYYEGVHVYGFGPDYKTDVIQKKRTASMTLSAPVMSPLDKIDIRQEQTPQLMLGGKASVAPDGRIDEVWVNGAQLPNSSVTRAADGSVTFSSPLGIVEGTQYFDVVAFDTTNCAFASQKVAVNWQKMPPAPPDTVKAVVANPASKSSRDPISIRLTTPTSGAVIWYTLDGSTPNPGQAGTLTYQGAILVEKDSVTLKAVATKTGSVPSGVTTEKYAILPYRLVNLLGARLVDRIGAAPDGTPSMDYRDGYADAVAIVANSADGAIDIPQALAQLGAAVLTGGFKFNAAGLAAVLAAPAGDTLYLPLEPNTLPVANGLARLTLALPGAPLTPADGMLAPGSLALVDAIAPVLRAGLLYLHDPLIGAAPDTLVAVFSEPLVRAGHSSTAPVQGRLFTLLDVSSLPVAATGADSANAAYHFTVTAGVPQATPLAGAGEFAYRFIVTASSRPDATPVIAQGGDWMWIDSFGGVVDTAANTQSSVKNRRVLLRIAQPLSLRVGPTGALGIAKPPSTLPPGDPIWSTIANGTQRLGSAGGMSIEVREQADPAKFGGIVVDATAPFKVTIKVYSNLGVNVTQLSLNVGESDFARLPHNSDGSRRLNLLWNGRAEGGQLAATGAYIYWWRVSGVDVEGRIKTNSDRKIYGLMRNP